MLTTGDMEGGTDQALTSSVHRLAPSLAFIHCLAENSDKGYQVIKLRLPPGSLLTKASKGRFLVGYTVAQI